MGVEKPTPVQSLLAGATAGGLEAFITYPTEYIKTKQQLLRSPSVTPTTISSPSPLSTLLTTLRTSGIRSIYTGSSILCVSNSLKSAVRFGTFDAIRNRLPRDPSTGRTSPLGTMIAGLCAGVVEGVTVVTPGETLKTKLIDASDNNGRATTQFSSTRHAVTHILRSEGIRGLWRGVVPVTMKQSANAVVRFTSYGVLLDFYTSLLAPPFANPNPTSDRAHDHNQVQAPTPTATSIALSGASSGIITVYATMPLDTVKTKLQSLGGSSQYTGSLDCAMQVVRSEGVKGLWRGTTPRLIRLSISSTLSFGIYEWVVRVMRDRGQVRREGEMVGLGGGGRAVL